MSKNLTLSGGRSPAAGAYARFSKKKKSKNEGALVEELGVRKAYASKRKLKASEVS